MAVVEKKRGREATEELAGPALSLRSDLGSLGPDEGDEVLVDEEDKTQAGDLWAAGKGILGLRGSETGAPRKPRSPSVIPTSPPPRSCC